MWLCATACQCLSASLEEALMPRRMALGMVLSVLVNTREGYIPVYYYFFLNDHYNLTLYKSRFFFNLDFQVYININWSKELLVKILHCTCSMSRNTEILSRADNIHFIIFLCIVWNWLWMVYFVYWNHTGYL